MPANPSEGISESRAESTPRRADTAPRSPIRDHRKASLLARDLADLLELGHEVPQALMSIVDASALGVQHHDVTHKLPALLLSRKQDQRIFAWAYRKARLAAGRRIGYALAACASSF